MAFPQIYCVEWLKGREVKRRGLAWLIPRPELPEVDGKTEFEKLDLGERQDLSNRFDYWLRTIGVTKKDWFHGWTEEGFENVFVFKIKDHRLFGFLCHPDEADKGFQMCVLCSHTIKDDFLADKRLKKMMQGFSENDKILQATKDVHEEYECPYQNGEKKK